MARDKICSQMEGSIWATKLKLPPGREGFPTEPAWNSAAPIRFCADWQGHNPDPQRRTEVRALWTTETLFLLLQARYRELYVFAGGNLRRNELWTRDVAEVFIQPTAESGRNYKEFEVSPNGDWLDLEITNGQGSDLNCALKSKVVIDIRQNLWTAVLAIPMRCLTQNFDPKQTWRVNFFRIEGPEPNRFYSAWHPTKTPTANFHVPEVFGVLRFSHE
jgi:hypothetical protein